MLIFIKMGSIVNLSKENINRRIPQVEEDFSNWLNENDYTIQNIKEDLGKRNVKIEDMIMALTIMDIEIETAVEYARKGDIVHAGHILGGCKTTKDFIYGQLIKTYGGIQLLSSEGLAGNMALWRDYIVNKFDGGVKRCELL